MGSIVQCMRASMALQALRALSLTPGALVRADAENILTSDTTTYVIGQGTNKITVSETEPDDPAEGDVWIHVSP